MRFKAVWENSSCRIHAVGVHVVAIRKRIIHRASVVVLSVVLEFIFYRKRHATPQTVNS